MDMSTPEHAQSDETVDVLFDRDGAAEVCAPGQAIELGVLGETLAFNLRKAQLVVQRRRLRTLPHAQVGMAEFGALLLCSENPGIAQIQIATLLDIDKASVVAVVDRLEEYGWAIRRRSATDRRRYGLFMTTEGARHLQILQQQSKAGEERIRSRFTKTEWTLLLTLLARVS
jgi:DNA-binding MarR family transcriptional regulator